MKIGFVGFGEVASVFSRPLREHGAEVFAYDLVEAKVQEVAFLPLAELVGAADYVLSTVTTQAAVAAAERCAEHLRPGQTYLDLNSTSPAVKAKIGEIVERSNAAFVEGAILGAVGASGAATRILSGGEKGGEVAETLSRLGLRVFFYSSRIGKASMFKMFRSIFSKGLEAIILELLVAGRRAGIERDLWRDVSEFMTQNPFERVAANWVQSHAVAHERRYHEMAQVTETMREIGLTPLMAAATEDFFRRSGELGLEKAFSRKPDSMDAVVAHLEEHLLREKCSD